MAGEAIRFNASLNTAGFDSGAKNLQNIAASASAGITRHFGKIAAAVVGIGAAFIGVRAAVQAFNAAVAMGGQLNDLSARTGETAGNLAILQRAFENAGAGAESVGPTINRLQRAIVEAGEGGKEQAEAFGKLGLNLERLKDLTPTEQLQAVASALQGVGNDSDRSAIAMQLLGRSGGELLPLLRAMGIELDVARGQLGSLPGVIDKTNGHLDRIGDNFAAIGEKGKEFMVGLLERLGPALADLTDRLANIDAAGFGAKLSEYAEATVRWVAETFKLGEALSQIDIAIKAITSGDFGEGLSLMFMTARNTALNAINEIVAGATAAMQTIGGALRSIFDPNSTTMAFINGSFNMLGAKLASSIFESISTVLEKIPFMGAAAEAVRSAQKEAEQAVEDISNIMYYEADSLKSEWGGIMAEMPKQFADSYAANAASPLIEMRDRLAEAEALSAKLAQNVADAGTASSTVNPKVSAATESANERIARQQAEARAKNAPRGGGRSGGTSFDPATSFGAALRARGEQSVNFDPAKNQLSSTGLAIERIPEKFSVDKTAANIRADLARMEQSNRQASDRAARFEEQGMFGAAERLRGRIDRRVAEEEKRLAQKYNLNVKEQAKTPEERAREEEEMRQKNAPRGGGGGEQGLISQIHSLLQKHMPSIDEKLPQHALVPG
jgi:hypothetical protein